MRTFGVKHKSHFKMSNENFVLYKYILLDSVINLSGMKSF
jgi:hypothetical protein